MKLNKILASVLIASTTLAAVTADAGSIGRSSSSSSSSGRSSSSSSVSRPSTPSVAPSRPSAPAPAAPNAAPAPSRPGGIGGTGSMGVRKSEVTAPVAQKVEQSRPQPATVPSQTTAGSTTQQPTTAGYGAAPQPQYNAPPPVAQSGGLGTFGSSFAGALGGTLIGNALFSNHGSGGTTVINNGTPSGGAVSSGGTQSAPVYSDSGNSGVVSSPSAGYTQAPAQSQPVQKGYSMWNFIGDLITFVILVALLVGIAWLFYKGYKMVRNYVNRERGIGPVQPFSPTGRFWEIQRAFASADVVFLKTLLGPDLVYEATQDLQPSALVLKNVSHEVVLNTPREFSVHYTFEDAGDKVDQVWHYELFGTEWLLNGIETV